MSLLRGHGLAVTLPPAWEGRIYRRTSPGLAAPRDNQGRPLHPAASGWIGDDARPVVHLANFALPATRGDFGSGAVDSLGPNEMFLALLEYGPECRGTALFAAEGPPTLDAGLFSPHALQRVLPGQLGFQSFFTLADRPMCLFVVIGSARRAPALARDGNRVLTTVTVEGR